MVALPLICRKDQGHPEWEISENTDEALPKEVADDLTEQWKKRHDFVIPSTWMLVPTLLASIYRGIHSKPPSIVLLLPEALRLLSSTDRRSGQALIIESNRAVHAQEVVADEVGAHHELFRRIHALFMCYAFASVTDPSWMSFQDALTFSDAVFDWIHMRYGDNRVRPPVAFFVQAYLSTMQVFVDGVRTANAKAHGIIAQKLSYQHFWTVFSTESKQGSSGNGNGGGNGDGGNQQQTPDVEKELNKARELAKRLQSNYDKQLAGAKKGGNDKRQRDDWNDERPDKARKGQGKGKGAQNWLKDRNWQQGGKNQWQKRGGGGHW